MNSMETEMIPHPVVESLQEYDEDIAVQIRALMPHLDESFSGELTDENRANMQHMIESDDYDICFIRIGEEVVGTFSLSVTRGAGFGERLQLEDVVVDPSTRGMGLGHLIIDAIKEQARARNISKIFLQTEAERAEALGLYTSTGARVTDEITLEYEV